MLTCYRCAKSIKGKVTLTSPPIVLIRLGLDFQKAFHPACYVKSEKDAEKELRGRDE